MLYIFHYLSNNPRDGKESIVLTEDPEFDSAEGCPYGFHLDKYYEFEGDDTGVLPTEKALFSKP